MLKYIILGEGLNEHDWEWDKVENNSNILHSEKFVEYSCALVEVCSLGELDILALNQSFWGVMHHLFELAELDWLEVHVLYIHYNMQGDEMNDAVLDGVLVRQHDDVYKLAEKGVENLGQA